MSEAQFLHVASEWVIQAAFWSALGFIAWYSRCAPWWRYSIGRAIVAMDSAIALATFPTVLGLDFGASVIASRFYSWLTVAAFAAIPVITIYRGWIVWRVQRQAARDTGHQGKDEAAAGSPGAG